MPFELSIADSTDATITGTRSTGACNTLLVAVLETPVIVANGKTQFKRHLRCFVANLEMS